jgi:hypothetical protein
VSRAAEAADRRRSSSDGISWLIGFDLCVCRAGVTKADPAGTNGLFDITYLCGLQAKAVFVRAEGGTGPASSFLETILPLGPHVCDIGGAAGMAQGPVNNPCKRSLRRLTRTRRHPTPPLITFPPRDAAAGAELARA